jgi:hypothetical protein
MPFGLASQAECGVVGPLMTCEFERLGHHRSRRRFLLAETSLHEVGAAFAETRKTTPPTILNFV